MCKIIPIYHTQVPKRLQDSRYILGNMDNRWKESKTSLIEVLNSVTPYKFDFWNGQTKVKV